MVDNEQKVPLPIRVPASYIERLDSLADKMQLDRSEVARRALRNGLSDLEKGISVGGNPIANKAFMLLALMDSDEQERAEIRRVLTAVSDHKRSKQKASKAKPGTD